LKNKLFLIGIIIILIFGIIGMGCDGGSGGGNGGGNGGYNDYGGGSGGSGGGDNGGDGYDGSGSGDNGDDGYDGSGGSGSGNRDPDYNDGSGTIIIVGSGSGSSRSYYTVKFMVTSDPAGSPVDITYSYPRNDGYNWSAGSSDFNIVRLKSITTPWENSVSISSKVIGSGVTLKAESEDNSQTLTARIFVDGKLKRTSSEQGAVYTDWR
jgi:hypothetical protein